MSTAVTTCPKCAHVRAPAASAPDWQCPACGIAYAKFRADGKPAPEPEPAHIHTDHESPAAERERAAIEDTGQRAAPGAPVLIFYVTLTGIGIFAGTFGAWVAILPVIALTAFACWFHAYRKRRAFEDVPSSRIASAAQGYVEIRGKVEKAPGCTLAGALTKKPCVWYHYWIVERGTGNDERTRTIENKAHGVPFVLRDETGECLVHPSGAEVTCDPTDAWEKGRRQYTEAAIQPGDRVYVIGSFSTRATAPDDNLEQKTAALLKSWLAEPQEFFARFDADRDRKIGKEELARARAAARAELTGKSVNQGGLHTLQKPGDGRPFMIVSAHEHDAVVESYANQVKIHLAVLIASIVFLAFLFGR